MARLNVLQKRKIGSALYLPDHPIEVTPMEAAQLLTFHPGVFEPVDFDPDDLDDEIGRLVQAGRDGKLKNIVVSGEL